MKKLTLLLLACLLLSGCAPFKDPVLSSLPSQGRGQTYTHGGFQDYVDYGKYQYDGITEDILRENPYFQIVTEEDIRELAGYLQNYEKYLALAEDCADCELWERYDFSSEIFREGEYFRIESKYEAEDPDRKYHNYDIYYFSLETQTLYYLHSNI